MKMVASAPFHRTTADKGTSPLLIIDDDGDGGWVIDGSMAAAAEAEDRSIPVYSSRSAMCSQTVSRCTADVQQMYNRGTCILL